MEQKSTNFLRDERKRLGFTQQNLAQELGVSDMTVKRWETGATAIPSDRLTAMSGLGFDVLYILTGKHSQAITIPSDEELLLDSYRPLSVSQKKIVLQFLLGGFDNLNKQNPTLQGIFNSPNGSISNSFNQ